MIIEIYIDHVANLQNIAQWPPLLLLVIRHNNGGAQNTNKGVAFLKWLDAHPEAGKMTKAELDKVMSKRTW